MKMPRSRWEDNIRMYLKEIGVNARNWLGYLKTGSRGEYLAPGNWLRLGGWRKVIKGSEG